MRDRKVISRSLSIGLLIVSGLRAAVDDTISGTVLDTLTAYPIDSVTVSSMTYLKKDAAQRGVNGRAFAATVIETKAITRMAKPAGQTQKIPMLVSQQNSARLDHAASIQAQWKVGLECPGDIICTGPKYHLPYSPDNTHLNADGYQQLGEKYAQVYFHRVILGRNRQPLAPISVSRSGQVISVRFHVPVPPLVCAFMPRPPPYGKRRAQYIVEVS